MKYNTTKPAIQLTYYKL